MGHPPGQGKSAEILRLRFCPALPGKILAQDDRIVGTKMRMKMRTEDEN
jgi:hypothetical protein